MKYTTRNGDALEEEMRKFDICDMEEFRRLESSEKMIPILGDRWWSQTARQDGDRRSKQLLCSIWKKRNERSMAARYEERCYETIIWKCFLVCKGLSNDDVGVASGTLFQQIRPRAGLKNLRFR